MGASTAHFAVREGSFVGSLLRGAGILDRADIPDLAEADFVGLVTVGLVVEGMRSLVVSGIAPTDLFSSAPRTGRLIAGVFSTPRAAPADFSATFFRSDRADSPELIFDVAADILGVALGAPIFRAAVLDDAVVGLPFFFSSSVLLVDLTVELTQPLGLLAAGFVFGVVNDFLSLGVVGRLTGAVFSLFSRSRVPGLLFWI